MLKSLFHYPRVFSRHANAPLAGERNTFLKHLAARGTPRSTLLRYARQLRVIAVLLDRHLPGPISREEIARCAQRWAQGQRQRGHAQGLKWPREHFLQVASAWCKFMGWLPAEPRPSAAYHGRIEAWASFLSGPEGLSETTVANYCWWASDLLEWLQEQNVPLRQISLVQVDRFMERLSSQGLSRVTLATAAKARFGPRRPLPSPVSTGKPAWGSGVVRCEAAHRGYRQLYGWSTPQPSDASVAGGVWIAEW
jgi:site-specific recombinase XerC